MLVLLRLSAESSDAICIAARHDAIRRTLLSGADGIDLVPAAAAVSRPRKQNIAEPRITWGDATKAFFWGKAQHGIEDVANEQGFPLKVIRGLLQVASIPLPRLPSVPDTHRHASKQGQALRRACALAAKAHVGK